MGAVLFAVPAVAGQIERNLHQGNYPARHHRPNHPWPMDPRSKIRRSADSVISSAAFLARRLSSWTDAEDDRGLGVDEYKGWALTPRRSRARSTSRCCARSWSSGLSSSRRACPGDAAAERIGWHWRDIARLGHEGRITTGRADRYLIADLDKLAEEADGEQYITAQAAADVLEIRPADWKSVEAAGWITPAATYEREVGRYRTVTVALYRHGDVRDVREMPGVDWEAARGVATVPDAGGQTLLAVHP